MTGNRIDAKLYHRHGDIGRHESEVLADIMRSPIYKALEPVLGLELESLASYPLMDHRMAEPAPEDGMSSLYDPSKGPKYRAAVWRVTKKHHYSTGYQGTRVTEDDGERDPTTDELTPLYPYVPTVRYLIAGGAGPRSLYLCTKLDPQDRGLLGLSYDTYPRMNYLIFSCLLDYIDGSLRIMGPARSHLPVDSSSWPNPNSEHDYSGAYLPVLEDA